MKNWYFSKNQHFSEKKKRFSLWGALINYYRIICIDAANNSAVSCSIHYLKLSNNLDT